LALRDSLVEYARKARIPGTVDSSTSVRTNDEESVRDATRRARRGCVKKSTFIFVNI